ncbi:hypothetical protein SKAU_G00151760 [Synaphobranchus kaupii]|uniref:CMP-N-acetylneuraminate-beta-galactosamide-alpha-2,3-sialyltransferase 2 n=1 Tax=Synaphobranchus kaupii TaxID=118154 RepID=A0A9Q1IXY0_SYNKA|nr:hypothetical protein SKAU_G00151760 [Synaphobranchus kaupii]
MPPTAHDANSLKPGIPGARESTVASRFPPPPRRISPAVPRFTAGSHPRWEGGSCAKRRHESWGWRRKEFQRVIPAGRGQRGSRVLRFFRFPGRRPQNTATPRTTFPTTVLCAQTKLSMQCKRKLCLCTLLCGILLAMIATHTIQKGSLLPIAMAVLRPIAVTDAVTTQARTQMQPLPTTPARLRGMACSCPSCVADGGQSEWFDQRYDPQQQPVLTAQNTSLPPLTLKWWLALQRSSGDVKVEEVIQKMFQVISSPLLDGKPRRNECRTCAVVGNSGNLLGSKFGPLIDSHATVIRMNKAITSGFEGDVGNKTTHHLVYPESAVDLRPGVSLVLLPFKLRDLQWVASALSTGEIKMTYMRVKDRVQADKDKVMVVNPTFFKYTHDKWTEHHGRYPSTGMLAIIFSLHICDEVSIAVGDCDMNKTTRRSRHGHLTDVQVANRRAGGAEGWVCLEGVYHASQPPFPPIGRPGTAVRWPDPAEPAILQASERLLQVCGSNIDFFNLPMRSADQGCLSGARRPQA